jgi:hypothetical protein
MSYDDYEPFGDEWVREMMKFDKIGLISMLREALLNEKPDAPDSVEIDYQTLAKEVINHA